ncbi:MAG: PEP-CTERM sorting domain-containing protein [Oscillatoria sp. SIO1A7]|nr:PEP-CTERM sorting domain-containing protein [Oscillatoria sp. SIO1A7]
MFKTFRHIFIGASVLACLSATAPALAGSLTSPTITGRQADYALTGGATLEEILQGSCETAATCNPGGNVKLMAPYEESLHQSLSSLVNEYINYGGDQQDLNDIKSTYEVMFLDRGSTSLSGILNNGKEITISSVTSADLYGESAVQAVLANIYDPHSSPFDTGFFDPLYDDSSSFMAQRQAAILSDLNFEAVTDANGLDEAAKTQLKEHLFQLDFIAGTGGTVSYVNQDDDGVIKVGIANDLEKSIPDSLSRWLQAYCLETSCNGTGEADLSLLPPEIQLSGLLKVAYDGKTEIISNLYSTNNDGLILAEAVSPASYNYQVDIQGDPNEDPVERVPEPSAVLGLMAVGGTLSVRRKLKKA